MGQYPDRPAAVRSEPAFENMMRGDSRARTKHAAGASLAKIARRNSSLDRSGRVFILPKIKFGRGFVFAALDAPRPVKDPHQIEDQENNRNQDDTPGEDAYVEIALCVP